MAEMILHLLLAKNSLSREESLLEDASLHEILHLRCVPRGPPYRAPVLLWLCCYFLLKREEQHLQHILYLAGTWLQIEVEKIYCIRTLTSQGLYWNYPFCDMLSPKLNAQSASQWIYRPMLWHKPIFALLGASGCISFVGLQSIVPIQPFTLIS